MDDGGGEVSRLASRPYKVGDELPLVGSTCLMAGANSDISCDQDRAYSELIVVGYTKCGGFICTQSEGCWPTVDRLTNCWFSDKMKGDAE